MIIPRTFFIILVLCFVCATGCAQETKERRLKGVDLYTFATQRYTTNDVWSTLNGQYASVRLSPYFHERKVYCVFPIFYQGIPGELSFEQTDSLHPKVVGIYWDTGPRYWAAVGDSIVQDGGEVERTTNRDALFPFLTARLQARAKAESANHLIGDSTQVLVSAYRKEDIEVSIEYTR